MYWNILGSSDSDWYVNITTSGSCGRYFLISFNIFLFKTKQSLFKQISAGSGTYDSYWYVWGAYTTPKPWGADVYYGFYTTGYYLLFIF